ncbi:MAG: hypothetical protein UY63_C0010G0001, partial [Parcubacteria group bacterium GW2011_GWA2_51_10]
RLPDSNRGLTLYPDTIALRASYGTGASVATFTPLEPEARLELATYCLQNNCSTN